MTQQQDSLSTVDKSAANTWLDSGLLCVLLGFVVLRCTMVENPMVDQPQTQLLLSTEVVSLLTSSFILGCIGFWFLVSMMLNRLRWQKTYFAVAVGVFILAGIVSAFAASNKRVALTDWVTLATPMIAGLVLVQLLNSAVRIRLALLLVLAVGIAATVQCFDQKNSSNQMLIEDYEADPQAHLAKLSIEQDSMEHWMYEHRLYSEDIRGFLMTSNSAASFFLLAVFAGLGLCLGVVSRKMTQESIAAIVCYFLALGIVLVGLLLTQSKGGIGGFAIGLILLFVFSVFGRTLWKYRRITAILIILSLVVGSGLIIAHGIHYGRLPGGNSMLVRWQYWVSTATMIRDHLFTGVGGGNFADIYTHYKLPAASETVQSPHNWLLSILSQYGPLGLIAFLAAVLMPLYRVGCGLYTNERHLQNQYHSKDNKIWIGLLSAATVMMLFVRPVLVDAEFLFQKVDVRAAAYLVLYVMPAVIVVMSFILLRVASTGDVSVGTNHRLQIALICGLCAVLIHNLIDFALFEPGIWTLFWLFIAILIARIQNTGEYRRDIVTLDMPKQIGAFAGLVLAGIVYLTTVLLPPIHAELLFRRSMQDDVRRISLIEKAIQTDPLSSKIAYQAAGIFSQFYQSQNTKDQRFIEQARRFGVVAADRNPASFKSFRLLARIEGLMAEQADSDVKQKHLQNACEYLEQAIVRYPGSGRLHYDKAVLAEQLGQSEQALAEYKRAVEIEDAYRVQFRMMYPERQTVISRLGNSNYKNAAARIEVLTESSRESTAE